MDQKPLSPIAAKLLEVYLKEAQEQKKTADEDTVKVNETISSIAFVYEKIRNVIDYKEDHLFRLAAIERFLLRVLWAKAKTNIGDQLVRELVRSGYLRNGTVPLAKIREIEPITAKYQKAADLLGRRDRQAFEWLVSIAASDVEKKLVSSNKDEALAAAFYHLIEPNIDFRGEENTKKIQLYLACQKALFKPALATMRHDLLLGFVPQWENADQKTIEHFMADFLEIKKKIDYQINFPGGEKLTRFCRRYTAPFLILKDIFEQISQNGHSLIESPEKLEDLVTETCLARYSEIGARLTRTATRSIIYIFLTKMLFALVLELPFDYLVVHRVKVPPLIINTLFPPALMFAFIMSVSKPGRQNTQKILRKISEIVYEGSFKTDKLSFFTQPKVGFSLRKTVFRTIYYLSFFLSFGLTIYLLTQLDFNVFSIIVFLFFVTVVSFFAYRIIQTAKELTIEEKEPKWAALVDLFFVPIIKTGKRFSKELSRLNIFTFIINLFIEAPIKSIFEIIEDLLGYLREKKEEIL